MRGILSILIMVAAGGVAFGQQSPDFEADIRPLLLKHCSECHGPDTQKSSLRLDARHAAFKGGDSGPVIAAGNSADSLLLQRITSNVEDERMPPEGPALPDREVELIRRWIDAGAEWKETEYDREAARDPRLQHWSFQPLKPVAVPDINGNDRSDIALNEIDRFVLAGLHSAGLTMNEEADRRSLIRRISFDMSGLPAPPERIAKFISDPDPTAWDLLIEEMLDSPRYGERWAQHWLDVVRYADTHGFEVNTPRDNAWHYRDYVIRALNEDKPYNQFVREQLAGDLYYADEATGFLVASAVLLPGQIGADDISKRLARQDALDEIIVGTSSAMLGMTIGCARCHDHKFDPITAKDYYSMQAFFAGVDYGERPMRDAQFQQKQKLADELGEQIATLQTKLQSYETLANAGVTLVLDEEDRSRVTYLQKENGPGVNPEGSKPGYRNETGSVERLGNISRGRYTWWNNVPGQDVMTYNPGVAGRYHLWLSWGAHGSGVHTRDARYVLDRDGDLTTKDDQQEVARIDQYFLAGVSNGQTEQVPLWSGLQSVGEVELTATSKLILRGGETGSGITADVVVLQSADAAQKFPSLRAAVTAAQNVERFASVDARFIRLTTLETINSNQHEPCIDELEVYSPSSPGRNLGLASAGAKPSSSGNISETGIHQLKHVNDGLYGNDHSWISNQLGGGWVQLELPEVMPVDRVVWGRDRLGKFDDRLPVRYELSTSVDGVVWTMVARSDDRVSMGTPFDPIPSLLANGSSDAASELPEVIAELHRLQLEKDKLQTTAVAFAGTFRTPDKTQVLRRGDPEQPIEEIGPAVPVVLANVTVVPETFAAVSSKGDSAVSTDAMAAMTPEQKRRLDLADWIASPGNPLTARVMVNRIWLNHFGRGLVDTPNDFGINGTRPSHPELLDWLAIEFIRSGWSVKHIHRLILQSATYRQSSHIPANAAEVDRDNILLWRFTARRLESEAIRDCMLAVSGELSLKMGGPGFNFFKTRGGLDGFPPLEEFSPEEMRRMIYSHKVRMEQVPVFGAFDCPDAGQSMPRRGRSTTAIQALNLFNSPFVAGRADRFAERINQASPGDAEIQVDAVFQLVFGRKPSQTELTASAAVVKEHGLSTLCRVLFNSSEFLFIP
jgi:mono/diheme cytochrome c family protein